MGSKRAFLFLSAIFFVVFLSPPGKLIAQNAGSLYFSVGTSKAWFLPSTIHIEQSNLGNKYDLVKVAADNKSLTTISVFQLSYRIGYYYNYEQTRGVELSFDPLNYHVADGKVVNIKGTVDNSPYNKNVVFSAAKGYYYYYNGANMLLFNVVRRLELFRNTRNTIRIDALGKIGFGAFMPHFASSLPVSPVSSPQFRFGGLGAGVEAGFRVTLYRYFYLDFAGKYDYAYLNSLKIYDGTAEQKLHSYEVIACLGFTFPTTKFNRLFWREHKITTILPFYQQAKLLAEAKEKDKNGEDSADNNQFREIPVFQDILDKEASDAEDRYRQLHPPDTFNNMDSIAHVDSMARVDSVTRADSIIRQDSLDRISDSLNSKKERKRRKRQKHQDTVLTQDSLLNVEKQVNQDSLNKATQVIQENKAAEEPKVDSAGNAAPPPEEKMSKKEEKRKAKQERKEAKRKEKEAEAERARLEEEAKKKAQEEEEAKKKAEEDKPKEESPPPDGK